MRTCLLVVFFKQKTAYEMRISDWSSDVCSSDLLLAVAAAAAGVIPEAASSIADLQKQTIAAIEKALPTLSGDQLVVLLKLEHASAQPRVTLVQKIEQQQQIGRASCRERVCQYV